MTARKTLNPVKQIRQRADDKPATEPVLMLEGDCEQLSSSGTEVRGRHKNI